MLKGATRLLRCSQRFRSDLRVESYLFHCSISFSTIAMTAVQRTKAALASISLNPHSIVSHAPSDSPVTWRAALQVVSPVENFQLLKTLVFKPKTAKSAVTVPVVVLATEQTEMSSSALAKKLNHKEMRLASDDLLKEFFDLDKDSRTIFLHFTVVVIVSHLRYHHQ